MTTPNGRRRIEYVLLRDVKPAKRNPKAHDDASIDASMDRFGYTEPTLLDERTGRLVAGHGRLERLIAKEAAGGDPPDGIVATRDGWKIPVVRGWSSKNDREAEAYLIASNRLVEVGGWNLAELAPMLADLAGLDDSLASIGYDAEAIETMLAELSVPNFDPVPPETQPRLDERNPVQCPSCGHQWVPR